ncbi:hypothetical protein Tco_1343830 [Tanacetum coccineum]
MAGGGGGGGGGESVRGRGEGRGGQGERKAGAGVGVSSGGGATGAEARDGGGGGSRGVKGGGRDDGSEADAVGEKKRRGRGYGRVAGGAEEKLRASRGDCEKGRKGVWWQSGAVGALERGWGGGGGGGNLARRAVGGGGEEYGGRSREERAGVGGGWGALLGAALRQGGRGGDAGRKSARSRGQRREGGSGGGNDAEWRVRGRGSRVGARAVGKGGVSCGRGCRGHSEGGGRRGMKKGAWDRRKTGGSNAREEGRGGRWTVRACGQKTVGGEGGGLRGGMRAGRLQVLRGTERRWKGRAKAGRGVGYGKVKHERRRVRGSKEFVMAVVAYQKKFDSTKRSNIVLRLQQENTVKQMGTTVTNTSSYMDRLKEREAKIEGSFIVAFAFAVFKPTHLASKTYAANTTLAYKVLSASLLLDSACSYCKIFTSPEPQRNLEGLYFDPSGYAWCYTYAYIQEGVTFIAKRTRVVEFTPLNHTQPKNSGYAGLDDTMPYVVRIIDDDFKEIVLRRSLMHSILQKNMEFEKCGGRSCNVYLQLN